MKKSIIFIILAIFFYCFSLKCNAASYRYEWTDTVIHVPVNESIEKYRSIPKATLYVNNQEVFDACIQIADEGDWLYYLKDVNTSRVGSYEVWYKAFEYQKYKPGTCPGYKCKVMFIVEDKIPPKIEVINEVIEIKRRDAYCILDNITATDNYSEGVRYSSNINNDIVCVENKNAFTNGICIVDVTVYAFDQFDNKSLPASYKIKVLDNDYPEIVYLNEGNPIIAAIGTQIDYSSYFTLSGINKDEYSIKYLPLDTSVEGEYQQRAYIENTDISYDFKVLIIDDEIPTLELTEQSVILDYKTNIEELNFEYYIKILADGRKEINYDNLKITTDIDNKVGKYHAWYYYTDGTNSVEKVLEISMMSFDDPIIEADVINCYENEEINPKDYINIIDPSDDNINSSLDIFDDNVDYSKSGEYYLEAYVINSSGRSTTKKIKVVVEKKETTISEETKKIVTEYGSTLVDDGNEKNYIIIIAVLVGIITFMLWKNKKNKKI